MIIANSRLPCSIIASFPPTRAVEGDPASKKQKLNPDKPKSIFPNISNSGIVPNVLDILAPPLLPNSNLSANFMVLHRILSLMMAGSIVMAILLPKDAFRP